MNTQQENFLLLKDVVSVTKGFELMGVSDEITVTGETEGALKVKHLGDDIYSLTQNGLMKDELSSPTEMTVKIYAEDKFIEVLNYRDDLRSIFQEVYKYNEEGEVIDSREHVKEALNTELNKWLHVLTDKKPQ